MYCYKYHFIIIEYVLPGIRVQYSGGNHQVLDPHVYLFTFKFWTPKSQADIQGPGSGVGYRQEIQCYSYCYMCYVYMF